MTYLIFDLAVVLVLLLFFLRGRKKGFILTLCGFAAIFVALFGARFVSDHLASPAADALTPHFTSVVEQHMDQTMTEQLDQALTSAEQNENLLLELLRSIGVYDSFAGSVRDLLYGSAAQAVTDTAGALAHAIAEAVSGVVIFILAFFLILALWFALSRVLNLAARLPIIHGLNRLLGGLVGLGQGALLLFFAAWILRLFGNVIPADIVADSCLLKFFLTTNPISLITGI